MRNQPCSWVVGLAVTTFGCSTAEDIEGRDSSAFFARGRMSFSALTPLHMATVSKAASPKTPPADPGAQGVPAEAPAGPVEPSLAAEFDFGYGHGDLSQDLAAGETIDFKSVDVVGPARVTAELDLFHYSIAARGGAWFGGIFGMEGLIGGNVQHSIVEVDSGSADDRSETVRGGPIFGGQLSLQPLRWLLIHGRGSYSVGFGSRTGDLGILEAGISLSPGAGVWFAGGWSWWGYFEGRDGSDVDVDISGPFAGLHLVF